METRKNAHSEAQEMEMIRTKWPDKEGIFKLVNLTPDARIVAISPDMPQNHAELTSPDTQAENAIIHMRRTKFPPKKT